MHVHRHNNGVCFKCGGTGTWEYKTSPEQRAKSREAARAKRVRRFALRRLAGSVVEVWSGRAQEADKKITTERKSKSQYVGQVGKREDFELTVEFETSWDTHYGATYLYAFRDADQNRIVWFASRPLGTWREDEHGYQDFNGARKGDQVKLRATVKDHSRHEDERQTALTRGKLIERATKGATP